MTWFYCDGCGDSIKKPKVEGHARSCGSSRFTCIDCSVTFDLRTVRNHTTCVSEHEKYALAATKPGGYAANGFPGARDGTAANGAGPTKGPGEPAGLEFLTTRPPWRCTICNVNCTSQDTLQGHAQGAKHVRRARAALKAANPDPTPAADTERGKAEEGPREETEKAAGTSGGAAAEAVEAREEEEEEETDKKSKDKVKWKSLAKSALKKKDGNMKLKKLVKQLLAEAGAGAGADADTVIEKLKKCGKFAFDGEVVRLKA